MSVKIMSDSTCDLSPELVKQYDIDVLPLHIVLGDQEYEDGVTITPDEVYAWSDAHKTTPKTSAVAFDTVVEAFRPYLEEGREIVCFAISEDMSTTANVMRLAAQELEAEDRVFIIDSQNLSTGIGMQVIEAAILAQQDKSGAEIVEHIQKMQPAIRTSFVVDSLTYLYRGGRCSGLAALAGSALRLHPKIIVHEGKMSPGKKYRGKMDRVFTDYAHDLEEGLCNARTDRVFFTHSGCDQKTIDAMVEYLKSFDRFSEILVTRAGCVVSSHCGANTVGIVYTEQF